MRDYRLWQVSLCAALLAQALSLGCDDEAAERVVVVPSGDVARLYEVVNDPDFEGYTVRLEPGTYVLDGDLDPDGWGQLVLQRGMTLEGANEYRDYQDEEGNPEPDAVWDPWDTEADGHQFPNPETETIIDGSELEPPNLDVAGCGEDPHTVALNPSAIVLAANSALRGVTVTGYRHAFAGLVGFGEMPGVSLDGPDPTLEVTDCVLENGWAGLAVNVLGCVAKGLEARGSVARNVALGNGHGLGFYSQYTEDVRLNVSLVNNRLRSNEFGVVAIGGLSADRCELVGESTGNIYERNGAGLLLWGQSDPPPDVPATGRLKGGVDNRLEWTSQGDRIVDNYSRGGVYVAGAHAWYDTHTEATGNRAEVRIFDATLASEDGGGNRDGRRADVTAYGYAALGGHADRNNTALLQIEGSRSDGVPIYVDHSAPDDPEGTNRVEVVGGSEAVESLNEGIPGVVEVD